MWKEAVIPNLNVLSLTFPGGTKEHNKNLCVLVEILTGGSATHVGMSQPETVPLMSHSGRAENRPTLQVILHLS